MKRGPPMSGPKRSVAPQRPVRSGGGGDCAVALAARLTQSATVVHRRVWFMVVPMRHICTGNRWPPAQPHLLTSRSDPSSYLPDGLHHVRRLSLYHAPFVREAAVV